MRRSLLLILLLGCHPKPSPNPPPGPTPDPDPAMSACEAMCQHIGPKGLGCEEGDPVYDSDLPGEPGVPNQSCTSFCEKQQENGLDLNPRCVARVQSCSEIETARQNCEL